MRIIGFGGSGHDWSCCVLDGPRIMVAVDEERITRLKYGLGSNLLSSQARLACLQMAELTPADIDYAVACDLVPLPLAAPFRRRLVRIQHHLAHAFGAFFSSPFEDAAIMIIDNAGSPLEPEAGFEGSERWVETLSYWQAQGSRIDPLGRIAGKHVLEVERTQDYYQVGETDNSLGHLYWVASEELDFVYRAANGSAITEDGKTMGLVAYGDNRYVDELGEHLSLLDEGQVRLTMTDGVFRQHIRTLLARGPDTLVAMQARRAAVAKAVQVMVERALVHCALYLRKRTGKRFLAMAGGVTLNCLANTRLAYEAGFDDVFVLPAAADNGIALGAALYGLVELAAYQGSIDIYCQLPFLGPIYNASVFDNAARHAVTHGVDIVSESDPVAFAAAQLAQGKVVAWYEGRSEFGPRALGHRSILADPRNSDMKDHINKVVKRREPFRPFSPMVVEEHAHDFFDLFQTSSFPFMLMVGGVRPEWQERLPAVTHADGTARLQTVNPNRYPTMYRLLRAFEQHTSIPILLNTSFNRAGEPIVETPIDAVNCFLETDIDLLVMEDKIFVKETRLL